MKCQSLHISKLKEENNWLEYKIHWLKSSVKQMACIYPTNNMYVSSMFFSVLHKKFKRMLLKHMYFRIFLHSLLNLHSNNIKAFINVTKIEWIIKMTVHFLA